jgi:DNA-binding GntR family transcriptional regulator
MATVTYAKSTPIPRQSLSAAVIERLRDKILSGELQEGEQLPQDAIASEFQISRIPVREALSHLAAEGLITIVANRGAVVSALSPDEITQMFETRAVLECYMLRCAIPNMKEEDFQMAEDILGHYEQSLEKDSEVKSWGQWNWSFHSALYAPAHRPVMLSFLKTLNINCDRYTRLHLVFTRDLHRAGQAHRELLDASKTKNPEIAARELWKHIIEAGEYLKEFIKRHRERHR